MQLFAEVQKYKSYIAKGGITISGGEPLLQADEVATLLKLCRADGIHTAVDTAGVILNDSVKEMLRFTDLVLLDIKSIYRDGFKEITGGGNIEPTLRFLDYLQEQGIRVWIRHVVVPNYTNNTQQLEALAKHLEPYTVIDRVELLPYHTMATSKYDQLGIKYPLEGVEALSREEIERVAPIFSRWNNNQ